MLVTSPRYGFRQRTVWRRVLNVLVAALAYTGSVVPAAWSVDPMATPAASADLGADLYALSVSAQADGPWIAAAGDAGGWGRVAVWNGSGDELWAIGADTDGIPPIFCAQWSPSGDLLLFCARDGMAYVYDRSGAPIRDWAASSGAVLACAFTPDGTLALTAGADGLIRVWDMASGDLAREMRGHGAPVFALDVSPNGARVVSGAADGATLLWTLGAERPDAEWLEHDNTVSAVTFLGDDRTVASAGWDGRVLIMTEGVGPPVEVDRLPGPVLALDVGADAVTLAAGTSSSGDASVTFWHVPSRARVLTLPGSATQAVSFVKGAQGFAAGGAGGARFWEARPETPEPAEPADPRTTTLEWSDGSALYYEAQVSRALPLLDSDTTLVTRRTSVELPEEYADGSVVWWRVRSRGFAGATDWSEPRSVISDGPPASVADVWVDVTPAHAAVGDTVTVQVMIDGAIDLVGFELGIVIEPGLLAPFAVTEGDALGADGSPTQWTLPTSTTEDGARVLSGAKGVRLGGGIDAQGALVTVVLVADEAGDAEIRVRDLTLSSVGAARIGATIATASAAILPAGLPADVTRDGVVDIVDLLSVATLFGRNVTDDATARADTDDSGAIDIADLALVARDFGMGIESVVSGAAPRELGGSLARVRAWMDRVGPLVGNEAAWVRLLALLDEAAGERAPTSRLLAVAPAYPNPSNPETWIPFALSRRADVAVALFDTRGFLVRSIEVGPREAGDHHHRGSAVHWDGRNGAGDRVSGGLYIARVTATPTSGGAPVIEHARVLLAR
ncbi:hypothetical protein HN371_01605 [Candidatus Poribacteria bacterium]|jgi:WD40 repeat protein|nr:hypothetical protein [Candidatus Poribacteria bacterium]MBT5531907.1 hypothetical protein [Candidatus Poribacteria bacterium]MBT7809521.1 hypothetical protein [Candidatus Poribacteria bacterium]